MKRPTHSNNSFGVEQNIQPDVWLESEPKGNKPMPTGKNGLSDVYAVLGWLALGVAGIGMMVGLGTQDFILVASAAMAAFSALMLFAIGKGLSYLKEIAINTRT